MAKAKVQFLCTNCGSVHPKWMGKCPDCGTWDSLQEYKAPTPDARAEARGGAGVGRRRLVLLQRVPRAAVRALAHPFRVYGAARVAQELGLGFRHDLCAES